MATEPLVVSRRKVVEPAFDAVIQVFTLILGATIHIFADAPKAF